MLKTKKTWPLAALMMGALIALGPTAGAETKVRNLLFLISDDLKASVLGAYGDKICHTPHIDRLAERGMLFERAYCQGTSCGPSRRSLMRSRYLDANGITLGEHLIGNGFYSARVGKIFHMRVPGDIIPGTDGADVEACWTERFNSSGQEGHTPGDYACFNLNDFRDTPENRQSTRMPHRMFVEVQYDGDGSDQPDHKTATKTIELLRQRAEKPEEPFFLAAGFVRPHYPMVAPRSYFELYDWESIELPHVPENDLDDIPKLGQPSTRNGNNGIGKYPDNQKRMWAAYYASTTFMDEQVGRILDELDRLGLSDSTAIVFTSDHGYHLGEHTFWQKSNLHEEVLRVPLIIAVPGLEPGRTDSIVELLDIYPTLSQLVGLSAPESAQGASLVPILRDPEASVKQSALSFNKGYSMRTSKQHFMRYNDETEELYDMEKDPGQFTNLARNPESEPILQGLREDLKRRLREAGIAAKKKRQ